MKELKTLSKSKVLEIADSLLGIPYKHLGRTEKGLDCFGLPLIFYNKLGYEVPDYREYIRHWWKTSNKIVNKYEDEYYKYWIKVKEPKIGDGILFNSGKSKIINHMGIFVDENRFLHAAQPGVIVTKLNHKWKPRIHNYYRLKEIQDKEDAY